ncbi:hypothetical protein ACWCXB_17150 [Streptomyces sp. NPDC001514]
MKRALVGAQKVNESPFGASDERADGKSHCHVREPLKRTGRETVDGMRAAYEELLRSD